MKTRMGTAFVPLVLLVVFLLPKTPVYAQALSAALVGNVTDATGGAIPGASITITNTGTGQEWKIVANAEGMYSLTSIPPGQYDVVVSASGFQTIRLRNVAATANTTVRADARLPLGQVSETVEVSAQAAALQTDSAVVRNEIRSSDLQNVPVPVTRNYQNLLVTVPGISPPQDAHSISANPSRALQLNSNGTTAQSTAVRVDGATSWNSWLPHIAGYVPALEAIEAVTVETGSYEPDLGFAGGAAVNVQIKSGTNDLHGSAFWYHNNQHMKARPYFLPSNQAQAKRILNQYGGTVGGPVVKNRIFYFFSYEATPDRQSTFRLANVPTDLMRAGNFSESPYPIYDPQTGNAQGQFRMPFAGNVIPEARISPPAKKIADLTPSPNAGRPGVLGANYFANGAFAFDRKTFDSKLTAQATSKLNLSARISYLDWSFINPPQFGQLGGRGIENRGSYDGTGFGDTLSMTYSAIYTVSPNFVIDGYYGSTLINNRVENIRLDENLGLDFLGIPGTNGPRREDGGWPGFVISGFDAFGRAQNNSPWSLKLPQSQYVANATWVKGKHDFKFGWNGLKVEIESMEPSGNPGFFNFNRGVTGRAADGNNPAATTNDFNSYAAFLLGLPNSIEKRIRTESGTTRNTSNSLYIGDRWRATSRLTVSMGLRWEYFGVPVRSGNRGLEIYNFENNELTLCGFGSIPQNCGFRMSKKLFAPRLGIAYRLGSTFVIRAGYGITWDPVNLGRNPAQTYPVISTVTLPAANEYSAVSTLTDGIPPVPPLDLGNGIIQMPKNVTVELADPNFRRNYIQSWNFMIQKEFASNWIAEAGYVGNRQVRMQNRWNANYGYIGGGTASMVLNRRFGRNATTNFQSDVGGFRGYYDSLQTSLTRRFSGGYMVKATYTWSKALGPNGNATGVDGYANNTPEYWPLIAKVPLPFDRTHNVNVSFSAELPFGSGKRWATEGIASAILGGWQLNSLFTGYTGAPFTVSADGASLNAPGNSQIADQVKPNVAIIGDRTRWFDTSAYAPVNTVRFGNSGYNQIRGPGMINVDVSIYRAFRLTERIGMQFRGEVFNVSNTPHFANPSANVSGSNFGVITSVANTGREGIDERLFRVGLRFSF
jgi:hypothetical protein